MCIKIYSLFQWSSDIAVPEDKQKELVKLIDEYLTANPGKDDLSWRKMIIFAVVVQIIFIAVCLVYNIATLF